ncbi:hypothetical protein D3C77_279750 [compost metagenome]
MSVSMPPKLLAKASGISSFPGWVPALIAKLTTTGIMTATVPVLLTKAPITEVTSMTIISSRVSLVPAKRSRIRLAILASPVWNMPPPTTNNPIIMMTTELEKPDKASAGVSIFNSIKIINEPIATRSERIFPETNNTDAAIRTIRVIIIGPFTVVPPM